MAKNLKLFIEGKDMTDDIGITSATHDTYAADYVDTIICGLQDKNGAWSKWRPKQGEELEVSLGTCRTGRMWIHKVVSTNGIYYITARSIPPGKNSVRTREWEGTTFLQTGQLIASELGLSLDNHGVSDQSYKRLYQMGEKNTEFFRRLCHQEGYEMTAFDGKLVVYDESSMEHQAPAQKIDFTGKGDFTFSRNEGNRVGSVQVLRTMNKNACGREHPQKEYFDEDKEVLVDATAGSGEGRQLTYTRLKPNDDTEGRRWAEGLLKNANKYNNIGKFQLSLQMGLAAGSVIEIKNDRASEWNGLVFLYRVKHDYKAEVSTLYFRSINS